MDILYCKKWWMHEMKPIDVLEEAATRKRHMAGEEYAAVFSEDGNMRYIVEILPNCIFVKFIDDNKNMYLLYGFRVIVSSKNKKEKNTMNVTTTQGDIICQTKDEIAEIMKKSAALQTGDELWISGDDGEEYPCLNILVKGKYACVHYFEDEGDVLQSCGDGFDDEVVFLAGSEEWAAPEDTIISFQQAVKCMEEFFDTMECPECIEWDEL